MPAFPTLDEATRLARLAPPQGRPALLIDTDCANEIDDQFALAWALLAPERLDLRAVSAAPFSFAHRRADLQRQRGWDDATADAMPAFAPPAVGMQRSLDEIVRVGGWLGAPMASLAVAGSTRYLDPAAPEDSPAVQRLIALAAEATDTRPLYVLALGCVSNIANALLIEPELVRRIVVVWTSGYPSHAPHVNRSFNLEQDRAASQLLFESGVPLVYLPGFHVGAQLRLSLPEMQAWVRGRGAVGDGLHQLFTHNPLWPLAGVTGFLAHSWVIWDLICVAWMLEPDWVPSTLVRTPGLGDDLRWLPGGVDRPWMREAHAVQRDAIFGDLFTRLATQAAP